MHDRPLDIVLVGRAGIDLNTAQPNHNFSEIEFFTKSVGGSPANIAQGVAKLGLRAGFIGKISGDGMGEYISATLKNAGIDIGGMVADRSGARNCLAITEIVSPYQSGSYLYRENTADLLIEPREISEEYIRSSAAVMLSGTAFSQSPSREAMFAVVEYAKRNGTAVMLDLDYRPCGWKSREETALYYSMVSEKCDVIIGNREEFNAVEYMSMPGNGDNKRTAEAFLRKGTQLVVVKDGANGSCAYTSDGHIFECGVIPTAIKKTFGSGDAFAAGLLFGLFNGSPLSDCMELGSACASLVLAGISCADAMPTIEQAMIHLKRNPVHPHSECGSTA